MDIKRAASGLLAALFCAALAACGVRNESVTAGADPYSALRLHVIANSDSEWDQAVKLAVRDAVLKAAKRRFEEREVKTESEAKALLMEMGAELTRAAEETLAEYGEDKSVQLEYGTFAFPDREYAGKVYPAGDYSALRVILGEGAGQNWWCVMFPPLCIIEDGDSPAEYKEDGTLEFKSFFAELFRRIFG